MTQAAATDLPAISPDAPWRNLRRAYLLFLHGMAIVWGAYPQVEGGSPVVLWLMSWAFTIAIVRTCVIDGYIAGRPILHIVQFIMLFTWPITAPAYVVLARRWRGALWALLLCVTLGMAYALGRLLLVMSTNY